VAVVHFAVSLSPGPAWRALRLEDHVVDAGPTSYGRAVDETLGRERRVRTVAPLIRSRHATTAARTAASSPDRGSCGSSTFHRPGPGLRHLRVGRGHTLEELRRRTAARRERSSRPARGRRARPRRTSRTCGTAAAPRLLVVTDAGQVSRPTDVDATAAEMPETDPAQAVRADARGCGRCCRGADGRWPALRGGTATTCPSPCRHRPRTTVALFSPRQVRAGVCPRRSTRSPCGPGRPALRAQPC